MIFYLDASAWVKRYVQEDGSEWVQALFEKREPLASATLGYVETTAALATSIERDMVNDQTGVAAALEGHDSD